MKTSPVIKLFLLILIGRVAHILEEVGGRFWLIQAVYGTRKRWPERPAGFFISPLPN